MLAGKTLKNRYKISQVLGSGGFGDTYLARDTDLPGNPPCVVKQLKPKDNSPNVLPIAKSLFEREAEYLYKLGSAHTQIPKLFAHFEENGEFFLVEEFVDGHSLAEEIPIGRRLSENATINLLLEILEVLAFVHQNNVIHRDIKLGNLMRRHSDRKIVLIDFGAVKDISALGTDAQGNTNVTVSIGSPGYMPSEQAMGKPRLSSDVYAVGMIGIQALTGIAPDSLQEDPNTGEVIWRDRAQVSPAFANILQTMVFYHFNQRYKSAIEAFHALQSLASTNLNLGVNLGGISAGNIAPTEAISYPAAGIPPTIITNSQNPISTPSSASSDPANTRPQTPEHTKPQTPATVSHPTISAPPSTPNLRPILWIALIGFTSVAAAIATAMILPNFLNNRQVDKSTGNISNNANNVSNANNTKSDVSNGSTPASTPITESPSPKDPPTSEPPKAETPKAIASPTPVATPSAIAKPTEIATPTSIPSAPPVSSSPSFGAIARSPTTQTKGYSWNYSTRQAAENRALSECENSSNTEDCQVLIWANNACMSIAEGSNGAAGTGWSTDVVAAENAAKQVCRQYQGIDCEVSRTICLPFRQ